MIEQGLHVPSDAADLTPEWLTAAMRASGALSRARVANADIEYLGRGAGITGRLFRVHLTYQGVADGGPRSVVVKLPATPGAIRDLAARFDLYAREARFYRTLAPRAGLPTPRLLFTDMDAGGGFVLMLEDLAPARAGDLLVGCGLEQMERLIKPIAAFHARWWNSPDLDIADWIPLPNDDVTLDIAAQAAGDTWTLFHKRHSDHLPPPIVELGDKLSRDRTVLDRLAAPPRSLVHGDLRINNLMFDDAAGTQLRAVVDWQTSLRGRAPIDIARLFVANLHPDDRRVAERTLLPAYHRALRGRGVRGYSYEECWMDYRLAVINLFGQTVVLSSLLDIDAEVGDDLGPVTGARLVSALLDLDLSRLIPAALAPAAQRGMLARLRSLAGRRR